MKSGETVTVGSFRHGGQRWQRRGRHRRPGRIRVCQFLEASGTSGLSGNVERLNAVLVDPPVTHWIRRTDTGEIPC